MEIYDTNNLEEKIIAATFKVLAKKNISGTRMQLIAEEVSMSTSHVHYYFKTKKELLVAVLNEIQRRSSERRRRISERTEDTLKDSIDGFFESKKEMISHEKDYDTVQIDFWVHGLVDEDIRKLCLRSYNIWREDIMIALEKYVKKLTREKKELIAYVMVSMMMGASLQYLQEEEPVNLDSYFALCLDMIINVI